MSHSCAVTTLLRGAPGYPELLERIHVPPAVLDVVGHASLLAGPAVAIVGSRKPSREGLLFAERLAVDLAWRGFVVVSGLAFGIDAAAHRGALSGGRTVAVLASGVDVPSPYGNAGLYRAIARSGAVASEFERGTRPRAHHFLRRNRIISGLALATVVVEAAARSGALITAKHAREQDREVLAVPGSPLRESSAGTNALLRDGAGLVRGWEDVVQEIQSQLDPGFRRRLSAGLPGRTPEAVETTGGGEASASGVAGRSGASDGGNVPRVLEILSGAPRHVDDLLAQAGGQVSDLLADLAELEIAGAVRQLPGKYFALTWSAAGSSGASRRAGSSRAQDGTGSSHAAGRTGSSRA